MVFRISKSKLRRALALLALLLVLAACNGVTSDTDGDSQDIPELEEIQIGDLLVYVPAGSFYMGSTEEDALAREDEFPQHLVRLDGFYIYKHEITNSQYAICVEEGECTPPTDLGEGPSTLYGDPEYAQYPVVGVNWFQAAEYCAWADARLPTEAEWEKTSRGEFGDTFPWGDDEPDCSLTNMLGCMDEEETDTEKIGQLPDGESEYEAQDMSGNVWEWTGDWYNEDYYAVSPSGNPQGPDDGEERVARGGSYSDEEIDLRSATRLALDPEEEFNNVGFRCVPLGLPSQARAPFCQDTYIPYCTPPGDDCVEQISEGGDEPGDNGGDRPELDLGGIQCSENGLVRVTIRAPQDVDPDDYVFTVGGFEFSCVRSEVNPDVLVCTGRAPAGGSIVNITACPGNGETNGNLGQAAPAPIVGVTPTPDAEQADQLVGVAAPAQGGSQLLGFQPTSVQPVQLAGYTPNDVAAIQARPPIRGFGQSSTSTLDDFCPEGYRYNENTGTCEYPDDGENCPEGWHYDTLTYRCEPDDENDCPQGTTYAAALEGCEPETGNECPTGYFYDTQTETCEPPGNDTGDSCPAGYYYDANIHCCAPIPSNNNGCEDGYYRNVETGQCLPTDDYGCGPNLTYNPYEGGCVPEDYGDDNCDEGQYYDTLLGSCVNEEDDCPEGTVLSNDGYTCTPLGSTVNRPGTQTASQTGPDCRQPGYVMNELGYCEPENGNGGQQPDCGPNGYYDTLVQECITPGDDGGDQPGCGPGYYYDVAQESCRPTDGPGSPCGNGYVYHTGLNCCVPTPGNDGTFCVGDGDLAGLPSPQSATFSSYSSPSNSGYDYGRGYCDPGDEQECPPGYHNDTQDGSCVPIQTGECPEGYHSDTPDGSCVPINNNNISQPIQGITLVSANSQTQTDCPQGYSYSQYSEGCVPDGFDGYDDQCGEGYYYDYELNFCVPTTCDGCALGYYFDRQTETCRPYDDGGDDPCPNGYYYDTGQESCVPYTPGDSSQGCWTVSVSVPNCTVTPTPDTRCPQGYSWDESSESCERGGVHACEDVNCGSRSLSACESDNCCALVNTGPPSSTPIFSCQPN